MQFNEFIKYTPVRINRLLLIESDYYGRGDTRSKSNFEIVDENEIESLLQEDIYCYGNFCYVDYDQKENIEKLEPIEIAELLYLGHMFRPLNSPFFDKIQNRYAYLSHDDGWFCRLYCRQYSDFTEIIANKITDMATTSKRRKIYPLPADVKNRLIHLAENGVAIDFCNIVRTGNTIEIPFYCIGKTLDMDDMYHNLDRSISHAKYTARLVHKNKTWAIDYETAR